MTSTKKEIIQKLGYDNFCPGALVIRYIPLSKLLLKIPEVSN